MKVLLHICCGPCTVYPLRALRDEGADVTGFFHNPNIHPYTEFRKRQEALVQYSRVALLPLIMDKTYDIAAFLRAALAAGEDRCLACYTTRLTAAFEKAAETACGRSDYDAPIQHLPETRGYCGSRIRAFGPLRHLLPLP